KPHELIALEKSISTEVKRKQTEVFGNRAFTVKEGDALYNELDRTISQLVKRFPPSPNGSRFVNVTCKVCPILKIDFSHLHSLFKDTVPGSLFLDEVGKAIDFGPLQDPQFGDFTTKNTTLKLTNIRYKPGAELRPNEHSDLSSSNKKLIAINQKTTYGAIDTNPALQKTEFIADVTFGDFKAKDMLIPIETLGDETTTQLVIALPELTGKIEYDGTIALKNGTVCNVVDIVGDDPREWVNYEFSVVCPFGV
ncbi:MAG: hypothetical protein JSS12_11945, partial [Verrucomicrobia bacterium]|nr:hypothetical protein [Verrucomicrobiota bacterium]